MLHQSCRQALVLSHYLPPHSRLQNLLNLELGRPVKTSLHSAGLRLESSLHFPPPEHQIHSDLRSTVGRVLLLRIAHGYSSVLLVLVRTEPEFVAMGTVQFHTALGKTPKVAAGEFHP